MIYIFDKTQAIIKVLTNDDFTAAHLNFKINTATTFEFSLPASKALPNGSKYVATPHPLNDSKFIMLRLTERVDNTETIDYSAYELAYQELATDGYIEDKRPQNQSALNLMKIALDGSNWELNNVNVSGTATTNFYYVDRLSAISKVVDLLGGEIVFYIEIQGNAISGRYMDYLARQGADTSKVFASGSNLLMVERQSDSSNIYTAILPRGKGEEIDNGEADTPDGYGRRINIADVEWKKSSGKPLDKPKGSIVLSDPDATAEWGHINGNARLLLQTYDDIDDVNVLINSAYKTLQSVNHPQIQYSATVADVGGLSLGDTVLIMHGDRDLSYKTRVFEVKYDLLSPDQTELSLGDDLSSNSITSQINNLNAVADTTSSQTQWTINQIGRASTTFGNTEPANPKVGDVFFKELPDGGTEIYRWNGDIWELLASPTTADDIAAAVDEAVSQANAHTDEVKQGLSNDISTAKSQAASQASTAEANAKSAATSQFTQAQSALSAAKTDLTSSIASEASARNTAVAAANSQAQTYANQAKADALNTIAKEVTDRQNAVSALDTKATNAVNQAKSDITDTINALSVGGRNLLLTSSTMSNTSAWVSPSIKVGETYQGMNISANTNTWGGPKYRISDLYNRSVINENDTYTYSAFVRNTSDSNAYIRFYGTNNTTDFVDNNTILITVMEPHTDWTRLSVTFKFQNLSQLDSSTMRFELRYDVTNGYVNQAGIKLEKGNKATDWTPAPEDVVLDYTTKDEQIKATITQYQTTNDEKVSKVQTDVTTALGQVATKVSQTDYDTKTGDLTTKYTQVKQTTDSQATDIVNIKETAASQDSKINSISSDVDGTKQSISDIETTQDSQSDKINQITTDVNGTKQSITDIQTKDGKQDTRMGTIETSVSGVKSDFSTYKTDANGRISTAQTTAQTAVDGLKTKVSQTDYNTKTGQLQTDLTSTTQTANQAKTDIVSIKQTDTSQDARMTQIESDASGVKTTVSNLQTTQGKQTGDISTLQQRADGFDATVSEIQTSVNNLGQINQLFNTEFTPDTEGWTLYADKGSNAPYASFVSYGSRGIGFNTLNADASTFAKLSQTILLPNTRLSIDVMSLTWRVNTRRMDNYCHIWLIWQDANGVSLGQSTMGNWNDSTLNNYNVLKWENISIPVDAKQVDIRFETREGTNAYIFQPMVSFTNTIGTYVPGNYNNNNALAQVKLTADKATLDLSTYKTDADGRISKAQTDITATANQVATKVSQTDYDQKTGDLTQAVAKAQTTADGVVTTVGNYQTSNDKRVEAAESKIEQNSKDITARVSQTDYDNNNSKLSERFTKVEATADGASTTVSKLSTTVNNLGQINQLFNTEFSPDFAGWYKIDDGYELSSQVPTYDGSNVVHIKTADTGYDRLEQKIPVAPSQVLSFSTMMKFAPTSPDNSTVYWRYSINFYRASGGSSLAITYGKQNFQALDWTLQKSENIVVPADTAYVTINYYLRGAGEAWLSKPMLVFESTVGTYVQGNYNNNAALAQVKLTADSISNFVRDSSGNISSEFQTALSKTSIITNSQFATSIQTQTATQITSALTDNNGNIISLINQDSSGVQIAGKQLILDGPTTVTSDFYAKGGNFTNLNASNITVGTLNGNQVNITNLNASNIVSGTITGININASDILLYNDNSKIHGSYDWTDLDEAIFPRRYVGSWTLGKRRLDFSGDVTPSRSEDGGSYSAYTFYGLDTIKLRRLFSTGSINKSIDINSGNAEIYLRNRNNYDQDVNDNISVLTPGDLQLRGETSRMFLSTNKTLDARNITNTTVLSSGDKDDANAYVATYVLRAKRFFQPAGYDDGQYVWMYFNPNSDDSNYGLGLLQGDHIISSTWAYNRTYSFSPNLFVSSNGYIGRTTSASKYKLAITRYNDTEKAEKLLSIDPARWFDKSETEEYADELNHKINDENSEKLPINPHFGLIAEDLEKAGLDEFVSKNHNTGEIEGLEYDRVWTVLIPYIRELNERIKTLEKK